MKTKAKKQQASCPGNGRKDCHDIRHILPQDICSRDKQELWGSFIVIVNVMIIQTIAQNQEIYVRGIQISV